MDPAFLKKHTHSLIDTLPYKNKHPQKVYLLFKLLHIFTHDEQKIYFTPHIRANKCNLSNIKSRNKICTTDK